MASQSDNVIAWEYTCDDGVTKYRLRASKAITDQQTAGLATKVGGQAATVAIALPPVGFKPRRVYVSNAAGTVLRSVVCYETDAPLVTAGETIILQNAGDGVVFTSSGAMLGERKRRGIVNAV